MEQKDVPQRHDVACSRCRERKIRCGRERPTCEACKSDGSECDYSIPEKRINHTKLLCQNFDRLEDRLSNIEGNLSWLTNQLKKTDAPKFIANLENIQSGGSSAGDRESLSSQSTLTPILTPKSTANRRFIHGQDDQDDQYHGPGTLLSLCYEMKEAFLARRNEEQAVKERDALNRNNAMEVAGCDINPPTRLNSPSSFSVNESYIALLERICIIAGLEPPSEIMEPTSIRVPPKQLLLMSLPQFFSQIDYSTDFFVRRRLEAQIERIYSERSALIDDAWAICFNTIILLVWGSESWTRGNDTLMSSQFSFPLLQAMRSALDQARFLTTPKLVNVQSLGLLSIAAERYCSAATSTAVFAQACLLARRAGLHQAPATSMNMSEYESQERYKTFMSLHLRDKALSLTLSSICWLPSSDHGLLFQGIPPTLTDPRITARLHLAEIQEQLYRYLAVEPRQQSNKAASEIASIYDNLQVWASSHEKYTLPFPSCQDAELQLMFLGTRILAYSRSCDEVHKLAALDDARASCIILATSYKKHDQSMLNAFESLHRLKKAPVNGILGLEHHHHLIRSADTSSADRLTSLIDVFPAVAFFQLSNHILWSQDAQESPGTDAETRTDYELLRDVYNCIAEVNGRTQAQNRASQVERTYGHILELILLMRRGGLRRRPSYDAVGPDSQIQTPNGSSLGSGSGDFSATTTLPNTDTSWDFITSPFSFENTMLCSTGQSRDGEKGRKRPRTSEVDFTMDGDSFVSFPLATWNPALDEMS